METVPGGSFSVPVVVRFVDVATDALAAAREEIDALNVYPIPDGDTGTNMFLTMSAAREALRDSLDAGADPATALRAFTRGALLGARGNSGVILSQLLGALVERIMHAKRGERNAVVMAEAIKEATDASYAAVGVPVEGTILSVARAASDAALAVGHEPTVESTRCVRSGGGGGAGCPGEDSDPVEGARGRRRGGRGWSWPERDPGRCGDGFDRASSVGSGNRLMHVRRARPPSPSSSRVKRPDRI